MRNEGKRWRVLIINCENLLFFAAVNAKNAICNRRLRNFKVRFLAATAFFW